jgi:hypothetical protein
LEDDGASFAKKILSLGEGLAFPNTTNLSRFLSLLFGVHFDFFWDFEKYQGL